MHRLFFALLFCFSTAHSDVRPPIIDMHLHAMRANSEGPSPLAMCTPMIMPAWDPGRPYAETFMQMMKQPQCDDPVWSPTTDEDVRDRTIDVMQRNNVFGVLSGPPDRVADWMAKAPGRFMPGLGFQHGGEREYSLGEIRRLHSEGRLEVFAEIVNQYVGVEPNDDRMKAYWALAEELDLPVGVHIGAGPPGVIYLGSSGYRARMHSPLALEEVLVRHPRLRVYIMHAGYPMLDDLLALLYSHPQVYVDVGVVVYTQPRPAFYRFLQGVMDAGFGKRVMFGSDQMVWPETIERAIRVIQEAPFLTEKQQRDVLYNNAARFLRLSDEDIARHHAM